MIKAMQMITLKEYADIHGKAYVTVRQKAQRGGFKTAKKIGRDWFINKNEEYIDRRIKSGNYIKKGYKNK